MSTAPALVTCGQCGAVLRFDRVRTAVCPFCASPSVLPRGDGLAVVAPAFTLAFAGDAMVAQAALRRWLGTRSWFTDRALRRARVEDLHGVYVPAYLYSAVARTTYSAQIGEHYDETESYTVDVELPELPALPVVDDGPGPSVGRPVRRGPRRVVTETRTRTVTRTEHRPLRGEHLAYVNDVMVSASTGLSHHELARLAPFELGELRRYSHALVAGFVEEEYSRSPDTCERASRAAAAEQIASRLRGFLPGDSATEVEHTTTMQWESLDPVLVPVWIFALRYRADRAPLRVLINGQTNAVVGRPPLVWWKLVLAGVLAAILLGGGAYLLGRRPP